MFRSTRIKLTGWYLLIIMAISLLFSVTIFLESNRELTRFERIQMARLVFERDNSLILRPPTLSLQEISAARARLIITLIFVNGGILIFSSFAGYFLAGRTLKPIKKMVDEQRRFITDASHELRTPLTSLRSEIEVALRDKKLTNMQAKKLLESNLEEVIGLQSLSDSLLELSQNGELVNPAYMSTVSVKSVVTRALKKIQGAANAKDIHVENFVRDVQVMGVEDRLTEAFVILLDNAIKYSAKSGKVEVKSKTVGSRVEISIIDQGIGISAKDLPYIFNRFYRSEKSRPHVPGYGLGLSIAKKIVESHGGKISVRNNTKDKKTIFTLILPTA